MVKQEKNTKKTVQSAKKKTETKVVKKKEETKKVSKKVVKKEPEVQVKNVVDKKEKRKLSTLELILLLIILFLLLLLFIFIGYPWLSKQLGWSHGNRVEQVDKKDQKDRLKEQYKLPKDGEDEKELEVGDMDQDTSSIDGQNQTTVKYIYGEGSSNTSNGTNQGGSGSGNAGGNSGASKPEKPVVPIATFRLSDGEEDTVTLSQANRSTNIVFGGSLKEKTPMPSNGINTGYYVQFMVIAPNEYSQDTLAKMKVSTPTTQYGKLVDGYIGGKPYFYMTQEFMKGTKSKLTINWGDGYEVTYALTFLVKTN